MPTLTNRLVVAENNNVDGVGGRKIAYLKNKELVTVNKHSAGLKLYKSTPDAPSFSKMYIDSSNIGDAAIAAMGNNIGLVRASGQTRINFSVVDCVNDVLIGSVSALDTDLTAIGNVSIIVNEDLQEVHAAWSCKKPGTYSSAYNIRYAKGKIIKNGDVIWEQAQQVTTYVTANQDCKNPSIVFDEYGNPVILFEFNNSGTSCYIYSATFNKSTGKWKDNTVYYGTNYVQTNVSAVFVPSRINGLAQGRIWAVWSGTDSSNSTTYNIRTSYSNDGGITWSTMQKLTIGTGSYHKRNPSITANSKNEVFIKYEDSFADGSVTANNISGAINKNNGSWTLQGSDLIDSSYNPNTIFDPNFKLDFSKPVYVFKKTDTTRIMMGGKWVYSYSSIEPGYLEEREEANIMSYSIISDGMTEITEKINGKVSKIRNISSGQTVDFSLTDNNWNDVPVGKYAFVKEKMPISINSIDWEQNAWIKDASTGKIRELIGSTYIRLKNTVNVKPNQTLLAVVPSDTLLKIIEIDRDGNVMQDESISNGKTIHLSDKAYKIYVALYRQTGITPSTLPLSLEVYEQSFKPNTITIEMGNDSWNYTFKKQPNNQYSLMQLVKMVNDVNKVTIPAYKDIIANEIKNKGGTIPVNPSFDGLADAIGAIEVNGKKIASGTATSSTQYDLTVSLSFKPSVVIFYSYNGTGYYNLGIIFDSKVFYTLLDPSYKAVIGFQVQQTWGGSPNQLGILTEETSYVLDNGFKIKVPYFSTAYEFKAIQY